MAETVADVMTRDPLAVAPEDTLGETAEKLSALDVGSALVTSYGRLVGIVTSRDLVRALAARTHSSEARVRDWMTADVVAVEPSTSVDEARALMVRNGFHHLPVVEGGRPVGVVGLRAVMRNGGRARASGTA